MDIENNLSTHVWLLSNVFLRINHGNACNKITFSAFMHDDPADLIET